MAPRFLIDENLSPLLAHHLRYVHGHDTVHVQDVALRGDPDPEIFRWAMAEDRIVITRVCRQLSSGESDGVCL